MPVIKSANVPANVSVFSMTDIEVQAKSLLARAARRAEQLIAEAQTQAESLKRAAYAQGLTEGKRDGTAQGITEGKKSGHDQALAEHREKFAAAVNSLAAAAQKFEAQRTDLEAGALRPVIELAAAIARRVAKRQAALDPNVLTENLKGAMKLVAHACDVRIALRPADLETMKKELPNLKLDWPQLGHIELSEDATLSVGGCRIFTASGMIDGDLDGQLDRIVDELLPAASFTSTKGD